MKKRQLIFLILTIVWMGFIFLMSSKEGEESGSMSRKVSEVICQVFVPGYSKMDQEAKQSIVEKVNFPVRKAAHASEYAILGMLLCGIFLQKERNKKRVIFVILVGMLYAASDEIHQLFVPDRAGQLLDVLIDSSGVIAGTGLVLLCLSSSSRKEAHKGSTKTVRKQPKP